MIAGGFNSAVAHHSKCSVCNRTMVVTLDELLEHEEICTGSDLKQPSQEMPSDKSACTLQADNYNYTRNLSSSCPPMRFNEGSIKYFGLTLIYRENILNMV